MGKKPASLPALDLHGARVDDVFDLLDRFLQREEKRSSPCVRVIHGIGTGKVKAKTMEYCRITGHDPRPDIGENGRANPGSFLLYL